MLRAFFAASAVVLVLAGCSAGGTSCGSSSSDSSSTCVNTGGTTPVVATPSVSVALSSSTVTTGAPATVTATVTNAAGSPVVGNVVNFSVSPTVGLLSATSALTDSSGHAIVLLSPATGASVGADAVTVTTTVNGTVVTGSVGYQTSAVSASLGAFSTDLGQTTSAKLAAYGQAVLTLAVNGASSAAPAALTLTSDCVSRGKATISPATTTNTTGTATFIYKDNGGCGSLLASDTVTASIAGSSSPAATVSVFLTSPTVNSLTFDSATPSTIYLKGSGYAESSVVKFKVVDTAGNPLPGQQVNLALSTYAGGVTLDGQSTPPTAQTTPKTSDADGIVSAIINSGTVPTPVRIIATLKATGISTVSSNLAIVTGLPAQLQFSLSEKTINIEGASLDGTTNTYTVRAADRSGNPVPDGTAVIFWAEGGQIQGTASTLVTAGIASATANFVSQNPRPADGRATIVAYAIGEESFVDLNGNNVWDANEPFTDLGDVVKDVQFDGIYDKNHDEYVSLTALNAGVNNLACKDFSATYPQFALDNTTPNNPNTCDQQWSGKTYVRRAIETIFSTSTPNLLWAGKSTATAGQGLDNNCTAVSKLTAPIAINSNTTTYYPVAGDGTWFTGGFSTGVLNFIVGDGNTVRLNPMPAGSTISVVTPSTGMSVQLLGGSPIPNTSEATATAVSFTLSAVTSGTFGLTVTTPGGTSTTYTIAVDTRSRPSICSL